MAPRLTKDQRRNVRRTKRIVRIYRLLGGRVKFVRGWKRRGGDNFRPDGLLDHDDISAKGESLGIIPLLVNGRSDLPGPLYNFWTSYGRTLLDRVTKRRSKPTLYVVSAGSANHAGAGRWEKTWTPAPHPTGNSSMLGHCVDFRPGESMHPDLRHAVDRFHVAVMIAMGWSRGFLRGHKEWAPGRKSDPTWSMPAARKRAAVLRKKVTKGHPGLRAEWRKRRKIQRRRQRRAAR